MNMETIIQTIWTRIEEHLSNPAGCNWGGCILELPLTEPYPIGQFKITVNAAYRVYPNKELHIYLHKDTDGVISSSATQLTKESIATGIKKFLWVIDECWDDASLEAAWKCLCDTQMDPDFRLLQPFHYFPVGTPREEIWYWFEQHYSKGVYNLLSNGTSNARYGIIYISKEDIEKYHPLMEMGKEIDYAEHDIPRYATIDGWFKEFAGGFDFDIRVCSSNYGDPLWAEAVLFQNGSECACSDVEDSLDGTWELTAHGQMFVVDVIIGDGPVAASGKENQNGN